MFAGVTSAVPLGREARLRPVPSLKGLGYSHMALRAVPFGMRANGGIRTWCFPYRAGNVFAGTFTQASRLGLLWPGLSHDGLSALGQERARS